MQQARVFTIPPGLPFLPTLADALTGGEIAQGWPAGASLADATIYLPTRRAGRALAHLLAERSGRRAILLPRILPLGEVDERMATDAPSQRSELPPAIPPLERRLILTRLVQRWAAEIDRDRLLRIAPGVPFTVPGSPADAVALAGDLEALMDALATENVDWSALEDAVEIDLSRYFRLTLDFVRIAHEHWPAILAERGASDPARRRNAALDAEATRIAGAAAGPIVAAGSTGSIPSTARLLAAVAGQPSGAIVLPGLDLDLDEAGWRAIGGAGAAPSGRRPSDGLDPGAYGHPQFLLKQLLERHLGLDRGQVRVLGSSRRAGAERRRLLSEILRPADTTDTWADTSPFERLLLARTGGEGIAVIEASDEREEALAIAVGLRETLAEPGRRAALVTPDRDLARRVAAELGRWGVQVEDTAGLALAETPAGRLARLAAEAAIDFQPAAILALLAHPLVTLGWPRAQTERAAAALEIAALRGPAPRTGLDGLATALAVRREARSGRDPLPRRRLVDEDWDLAAELLDRLARAFAFFSGRELDDDVLDLVALAGCHAHALNELTAPAPDEPREPGADERALDTLFDELATAAVEDGLGRSVLGRFGEYPAFFAALARVRVLAAEPRATHRRVKILGLLEARLLDADRVVLGGLDETIWPPAAETDAFLNRPMRLKLGLTPPERRIGQTAHDFVQALAVPDAIVTRAKKRDGKPTVPSRFLERMRAFVGDAPWSEMVARGTRYCELGACLDRPAPVPAPKRPAPRPGAARFPRRLSVTAIETLVRDPYAIYARHVLRLEPLDRIAVPPSSADRGTIVHDILAGFASRHPGSLPPEADQLLLQLGLDAFRPIETAYPELHALWWPAFERFMPVYLDWERERRRDLVAIHVESPGRAEFEFAPGESFALTGRADRIEVRADGRVAIVDYKTGVVPTNKVVAVGFSPQMTLQAAMLMRGGFRAATTGGLPELLYLKIGGKEVATPRAIEPPKGDARSMADIVAAHRDGLLALVRQYGVDGAGYLSRPYPQYARTYAPYDHLARVKEWSLAGDAAEGGPL